MQLSTLSTDGNERIDSNTTPSPRKRRHSSASLLHRDSDPAIAPLITSPRTQRIENAQQRNSSLDHDCVEGYMAILPKKPRKLFKLHHRKTYFVVSDSHKPVLEIYGNETRSELIYILSLSGATLSFESDDANIVMEKCFCVETKSFNKRNTMYFRPRGFIFFEEDQTRMLLWVKCIHLAIKRASQAINDGISIDRSLVSEPDSLLRVASERSDSLVRGRSHNDAEEEHSRSSDRTASSDQILRRPELTIDASSTKDVRHHFPRLNSMFFNLKSPASASNLTTSTTTTTTGEKEKAVVSDIPLKENHKPRIFTGLHALQAKAVSVVSPRHNPNHPTTIGSKRLSESFSARKKEEVIAPLCSARDSRSQTPVPNDTVQTVPIDIAKKKPLEQSIMDSVSLDPTLETQVSMQLKRFFLLTLAAIGGHLQLSPFFSIAAAGVFTHVNRTNVQSQNDGFVSASVASMWVYLASLIQSSLGLCSILFILYGWSYADFKSQRRQLRRNVAEQLEIAEKANFAHVEIPNWLSRPDVDRVEWLNKVLVTGWPYMKLAIRNSLMWSLNPLLESTRPTFMSELALIRIDLGDKTPHLSGVKFVHTNAATDEVTLDVEVRIVTDESFVAELRMVSKVGAAAVVTLRDLFLVGTLRVTLHPLCVDWPCFSALSLSFTTRPVFDFSLTAAKINLSNVPFASEWLHTYLHDLLIDYVVWPKVYRFALWDDPPP